MRRPLRLENPTHIDTPHYRATVATDGYVSGVAGGSFLDKATGARDLGFGLAVVDFLLEPAPPDAPVAAGQYHFGPDDPFHGTIPKRYVEGPQICTQARHLTPQVVTAETFTAVQLRYQWHVAYEPRQRAGSRWEQTLVFPRGERFFLASDRVTTVSRSPELFLRIDMPGHIKHDGAKAFTHVYLSYNDPPILPATEFLTDFPPDARLLYRRGDGPPPERFIRAYQVALPGGGEGPWLAGMTLEPADVYQAWCHQRGYVCLIEEIGGRPTEPGDTFGACYLIGWFNSIEAMHRAYDRFRGWSGLALDPPDPSPSYRGLAATELTPVGG